MKVSAHFYVAVRTAEMLRLGVDPRQSPFQSLLRDGMPRVLLS